MRMFSLGRVAACGLFLLPLSVSAEEKASTSPASQPQAAAIDGAELFAREWLPGDARSHGGDGLGPVFNETSCVSCHNQGGAGGGGAASKNVEILTAFGNAGQAFGVAPSFNHTRAPAVVPQASFTPAQTLPSTPVTQPVPANARTARQQREQIARQQREAQKQQREQLIKLHPGFRNSKSVVLHRFGVDEKYDAWRRTMRSGNITPVPTSTSGFSPGVIRSGTIHVQPPVQQATFAVNPTNISSILTPMHQAMVEARNPTVRRQVGGMMMMISQRNTTALFGVGQLDAIPDEVLLKAAERKFEDYPEITGRVSRLKNGRIGKFGWKAQIASLEDFTLTACAVELGLNVPERPQAGVPHKPEYIPAGLDLTAEECNALTGYLKQLPQPKEIKSPNKQHAEFIAAGHKQFARIGCAACHTKDLGEAQGVYSDLLLHDLGATLGDTGGSYGAFIPNESPDEPLPQSEGDEEDDDDIAEAPLPQRVAEPLATQQEWRTPPLWGVRDSAPYMHDGRAQTLEQAIALHGGEATRSAQRYFALLPNERQQVLAMLKSLTAPMDKD